MWAGKAPNCIVVSGGHLICSESSTSTLQFLNIDEPQGFSAMSPAVSWSSWGGGGGEKGWKGREKLEGEANDIV